MKTDIEIAQEAKMEHIAKVAGQLGITEDELELYGKYKAKLSDELMDRVKDNPDGKLVLVTAINPTPAGEGKTTTSIGLAQAMGRLNQKAVLALREPSLGPCFGIKGGAAGGGYAQVVPMEDLNLHFTGDFHAITSANNLLAAMLDNHIQQGNALCIDPRQVVWKRCLDMNDRVLRNIVVGLGSKMDGMVREDHFVITVATEIMAVLCLAADMDDLKRRLGRMIVAYSFDGKPVTRRRPAGHRRHGGSFKRRTEAEPDPDAGAYAGHRARRTVRQYCPRLQQCAGNPYGHEAGGYYHHGGRIRRGSGGRKSFSISSAAWRG